MSDHISKEGHFAADPQSASQWDAVVDSDSLYASLVENLPVYVIRKDLGGRITFVNRLFADLVGAPPDSMLGKTDYDFFPRELAEKYRQDDCRIMDSGEPFQDVEENVIGGTTRYFEVRKTPVRDRQGRIIGTQAIFWDVTGRRQAEFALRESQERLQTLVEHAPEAIVMMDVDSGVFVRANKKAVRLFKLPLEKLLGASPWDLSPTKQPDGRPSQIAAKFYVERALQGQTAVFEWVHQDSTGRDIPCEVRLVRLPSKERRLVRASITDITARKDAEKALEYERYLLHTLLDKIPDSIYFKDQESRFVRVSKGLSDKFGLSDASQAIGRTDADFFSDEHALQARNDELDLMRTGNPVLGKVERETWSDGRETWCSSTKLPLRDKDGNIIGSFGISRDITELHRAEEALARERDLLRTLMDNLPDLIYVKDCDGRFVTANKALLEFLRVESIDDVRGKTNFDFTGPDQATRFQQEDREVIQSGRALINRETHTVDRDGHERWFLTTKVPLRDSTGRVTGVIGIDRNITMRKRAEEQLRTAKEAADAASRAKSDFLANMSHEIRTPMNAIIGMTDLLLDMEVSATQREYLEMVSSSSQSLLTLINDVLDFSKIEAGKLELDPSHFDVRDALGDALKSLAVRAHAKGLELAYHIDAAVPAWLHGDSGRLRQVVVNLVGNAIKFTEQGEVVLEARCGRRDGNRLQLEFRIRDTGIGIPPEKTQSIFYKFEQVDTSTTRRYGGSGLGLAISSRIVEMMGGRILVESEVGKGSTFRFDAWFEVPDHDFQAPSSTLADGIAVLVVDDNATNRRILNAMLQNWGAHPEAVSGATEAIERLRDAQQRGVPYRMVLSDVNMPDVDGFTLASWIRHDARLADTPILLLTSGTRAGDQQKRESLGIGTCLLKPVKQSELFNAIVNQLGGETYPSPTVAAGESSPPIAPLKVLLAEDNLVNQRLAGAVLSNLGHTVTIAVTGRQALDIYRQQVFDLVLMDVQMPEMDGLDATRAIRELETTTGRHTPIVAMTAHALKGDRERCLEAGMDDYLAKPIRAAQLNQVLARVVGIGGSALPAAITGEAESSIDWTVVLEAAGGSRELLADVLDAVVQELPRFLEEIRQSIQHDDPALLKRAAHSLKGSLLFLQIDPPTSLARELEALGDSGTVASAQEKLDQLTPQVERLLAECRRVLESGG